jgi:hypothetical protein
VVFAEKLAEKAHIRADITRLFNEVHVDEMLKSSRNSSIEYHLGSNMRLSLIGLMLARNSPPQPKWKKPVLAWR